MHDILYLYLNQVKLFLYVSWDQWHSMQLTQKGLLVCLQCSESTTSLNFYFFNCNFCTTIFVSFCRVQTNRKKDSYVRVLGWPVKAPLFPVPSSAKSTSSSWSAAYVWTATRTLRFCPACIRFARGEWICGAVKRGEMRALWLDDASCLWSSGPLC